MSTFNVMILDQVPKSLDISVLSEDFFFLFYVSYSIQISNLNPKQNLEKKLGWW